MSRYLHCDGPDCGEVATEEAAEWEATSSGGRIFVKGWPTLDYGDEYHFHDLRCLTAWIGARP